MPIHRQNIPEEMAGVQTIRWVAFVTYLLVFLAIMNVTVAKAHGANTLSVSATVLSKNQCKFNSSNSTLNFGALDTGSFADVTQSTSVQFVCRGSAPLAAFAFTTNDGLYDAGPSKYRMRHATVTTEFLPYSLSLSPTTGTAPKNVTQTLTISGTVKALDYQPAQVGNYADTVVITLNP
jgi:spore coat protein U domain-containing protein, fimbrial subunit CupE1/2/3/6